MREYTISNNYFFYKQKYAESHGGYIETWPWSGEVQDNAYGNNPDKFKDFLKSESTNADDSSKLATSSEHLPIPMALETNGKISPAKKNLCKSIQQNLNHNSSRVYTNCWLIFI